MKMCYLHPSYRPSYRGEDEEEQNNNNPEVYGGAE